jgi:predicted enzyme related to lactoylglutathione lyase
MDQFYTEELMHAFGHIEIPTTNLEKSKKFFGTVFGWTFSHIQDIDYTIIHTGKHPNGGFEIVKRLPKKGQVIPYIEVEDIDTTIKTIRKAHGKVLTKKSQVGSMGWRAQFETPEGVQLALWQSTPRQ